MMIIHLCAFLVTSLTLCRAGSEEPPNWQSYLQNDPPEHLGYWGEGDVLSSFQSPSHPAYQAGYDESAGDALNNQMHWQISPSHHNHQGGQAMGYDQLEHHQSSYGSGFWSEYASPHQQEHAAQAEGEASHPTQETRLPKPRHRWSRGKVVQGAKDDILGDSDDDFFMPSRTPELRAKVGRLWRQKGQWVGMPVKELAAGMAEIKVQLGCKLSRSIGHITANHVGDHDRASASYKEEVQSLGKRFTKKIIKLEKNSHRLHPDYNSQQHEVEVLSGVRFLNDRDAYIRSKKEEEEEEVRLDAEAERAWSIFSASHELALEQYNAGYANTPASDLPMEVLERAARHLFYPMHPASFYDLSDLLRRHMLRSLHKTPTEIDLFNKSRNSWLKEVRFSSTEHMQ